MAQVGLGVFGKIPRRGDFISMGLPRTLTDRLEAWVKFGLGHAAKTAQWEKAYFSSPIWQFTAAAKFWDNSPWSGLIVPSVDSIGRKFPLIIAAPVSAVSKEWLANAQAIALQALTPDDFSFDHWKSQLSALKVDNKLSSDAGFIAPLSGGVFRAMSATNDEIYKYTQANLKEDGYADLILSDLNADTLEEALL